MAKKDAATATDDVWDGTERRVQVERRKGRRGPFQEYPKTVRRESDGATFTVMSKEHEDAALAGDDMARTEGTLDVPLKKFTMSAEDADGTAARMARPGDPVPGDQSALHPATVGQRAKKDAAETRSSRSSREK